MGNCCRHESSTVWASVEDEWEDLIPRNDPVIGKECLAGDDNRPPATQSHDQLKIKITKKELEELLATARLHQVPVHRLLSRLITAVDHSHLPHQRSWSPSLHSIAELD